ncbi:MAG: winged helix-turn-helix domain-containing protein [Vicinamibacteria bacterium]
MSRYYVGEWLVEPEQSRVVRGSESRKLDPKSVQVLTFLAEHPDEVLSKERIIDFVWNGAFVSEEVLTTAIWSLRKALGDDAKEPRYIQTIPRQGYRLIAPVERVGAPAQRQWEPSPYPGLSAFSERDAPYFFGREEEVEALWSKLQERRLLGVIGPSGAGKSSLLRAGLIPSCPPGWGVFLRQPRNDPFLSFEGVDVWRTKFTEALLIVDQFEELFTLNDEETERRFSELLGRWAESGVHVLLSMRDDFLIRCHAHPALAPVFEKLTPILPLSGAALRKSLVEPARAVGYRFEDESLVAEILGEVSREKGALPLVAFAAWKLWEKRDREGRRLRPFEGEGPGKGREHQRAPVREQRHLATLPSRESRQSFRRRVSRPRHVRRLAALAEKTIHRRHPVHHQLHSRACAGMPRAGSETWPSATTASETGATSDLTETTLATTWYWVPSSRSPRRSNSRHSSRRRAQGRLLVYRSTISTATAPSST